MMKNTLVLLAVIIAIANSSCIKYRTKYSCESNCQQLTIQVQVDNQSGEPVLANTAYEIILLEKFSGSTQNNRIMAKGNSDNQGNISTTVSCDTSLLNEENYYIKIDYKWDVNAVKVCFDSSFKIEQFPTNGTYLLPVRAYKKWQVPLSFQKTSSDSLKTAYCYIEKDCFSSTGYSLSTKANQSTQLNVQTVLNGMNYLTISTTDSANNIHLKKDSFYVDKNFSGKSFVY